MRPGPVTWLLMALGLVIGTILSPLFWLLSKAGILPRRNRGPRA